MKIVKRILIVVIALILLCVIGFCIIASPWILLSVGLFLSPAPPKPEIKYGEFDFELVYEIDGESRTIEDTIICEFDGFNIDEANGKTRKWEDEFVNKQNNELYAWRVEQIGNPEHNEYKHGREPDYDSIVLKNIDNYKVLLKVDDAYTVMGEPGHQVHKSVKPSIKVYDKNICYYLDPDATSRFLWDHNFRIISWECDDPIENTFK